MEGRRPESASRIWLTTTNATVATVVPGPESVRVETNMPKAAIPAMLATT